MRISQLLLIAVAISSCTDAVEPCAVDGQWSTPESRAPGGGSIRFSIESRGDSLVGTGWWEFGANGAPTIVTGVRQNGDYVFESRFEITEGPFAGSGPQVEQFTAALYCPDLLSGSGGRVGGVPHSMTMVRAALTGLEAYHRR